MSELNELLVIGQFRQGVRTFTERMKQMHKYLKFIGFCGLLSMPGSMVQGSESLELERMQVNLNLQDLAVPTGTQVDGVPTFFDLWPGQIYTNSFGQVNRGTRAYLLALADVARADDPTNTFRVAAATVVFIPEPATTALGLLAFAALGLRRCRGA